MQTPKNGFHKTGQTNVKVFTLNPGKAVGHDNATTGFKKTYVDLPLSSKTYKSWRTKRMLHPL